MSLTSSPSQPLLQNRLDIHDRKQFELKLEYQPSGAGAETRYHVETYLFLPASLNIDEENYPREDFYGDIHNYVRLKTPVFSIEELIAHATSPLLDIERATDTSTQIDESQLVYDVKLLSCVFRGALRRFAQLVDTHCNAIEGQKDPGCPSSLEALIADGSRATTKLLTRFRAALEALMRRPLQEKTRVSVRLVDEYMSLSVEQFFRKAVTDMDVLPRTGAFIQLRKELMAEVLREEDYRKANKLRSVLSPTGDNEEYMHRIGFLKKFCMNILFLAARRTSKRRGFEEVLFAIAAGLAMTFATGVAFWAQLRFPQISMSFFLALVVGYMLKDRIKEGLRRGFASFAAKHLFDRTAEIVDPVTKREIATCKEKVEYGAAVKVPEEINDLRRLDDFVTVSQGELSETVIRYQKEIVLDVSELPHVADTVSGVTDIIRLNVERLLRDMDDPELSLEYVDMEDFSIGRVRGAKSYQVDLAFRFTTDEAAQKRTTIQLVRLVLDRNGIKRMLRFDPPHDSPAPLARSAA